MEIDCRGEINQCIAVILLLLGWGFLIAVASAHVSHVHKFIDPINQEVIQ